jgi:hypothetical protein
LYAWVRLTRSTPTSYFVAVVLMPSSPERLRAAAPAGPMVASVGPRPSKSYPAASALSEVVATVWATPVVAMLTRTRSSQWASLDPPAGSTLSQTSFVSACTQATARPLFTIVRANPPGALASSSRPGHSLARLRSCPYATESTSPNIARNLTAASSQISFIRPTWLATCSGIVVRRCCGTPSFTMSVTACGGGTVYECENRIVIDCESSGPLVSTVLTSDQGSNGDVRNRTSQTGASDRLATASPRMSSTAPRRPFAADTVVIEFARLAASSTRGATRLIASAAARTAPEPGIADRIPRRPYLPFTWRDRVTVVETVWLRWSSWPTIISECVGVPSVASYRSGTLSRIITCACLAASEPVGPAGTTRPSPSTWPSSERSSRC